MTALTDFAANLFAGRAYGKLHLIYITATIGVSGAVTLDTALSKPNAGLAITHDSTGEYSIAFPKGQYFIPLGFNVQGPSSESEGSALSLEVYSAVNGTATFETAVTPGTAADPTSGSRLHIAFLVGRF